MEPLLHFLAEVVGWGLKLYLWMMLIAVLLTWVSPDPRNAIVRFLNTMCRPVWDAVGGALPAPLKLFSAYIALLLILFALEFLPGSLHVLAGYAGGKLGAGDVPLPLAGFFLRGVGVVLYQFLSFLILLLLIWFALTLVSPNINNPIVRVLFVLVDPFITPLQRLLPRLRVDLSPLLAAGICLALNVLVVSQLLNFATQLTTLGAPLVLPGPRL